MKPSRVAPTTIVGWRRMVSRTPRLRTDGAARMARSVGATAIASHRPRERGCQEILRTDNSSSPRKRGPRGKRLKSLGSRFRGNDEQRAQRWDMRELDYSLASGDPEPAPSGNTLQQAYWKLKNSRISTLIGEIALPDRTTERRERTLAMQDEAPEKGLNRGKQRRAAVANIVHSYDASHLCRVVNAAGERGLADFAVVHDSV